MRREVDKKNGREYTVRMEKINILVVYHKESPLIKSEVFLPINAGRAIACSDDKKWLEQNTVGDDSGENISALNPVYNELTAVYWAWKNLESDYYGLMHYRRHFVFSDKKRNYYVARKIGKNYLEKIGYSHEKLVSILSEYDFIAPKPMREVSVYKHYKNAHDAKDIDAAIEAIKEFFPEYSQACDKYVFGQNEYFYNMFVFDKITFNRYCEFLFGVLDKIKDRFEGKRMFISERITGIFIEKLILEGKQGKFLPTIYIEKKIGLKKAIALTKINLKNRTDKGIKSLIYAFKPILEQVLPSFVFSAYRNRK